MQTDTDAKALTQQRVCQHDGLKITVLFSENYHLWGVGRLNKLLIITMTHQSNSACKVHLTKAQNETEQTQLKTVDVSERIMVLESLESSPWFLIIGKGKGRVVYLSVAACYEPA